MTAISGCVLFVQYVHYSVFCSRTSFFFFFFFVIPYFYPLISWTKYSLFFKRKTVLRGCLSFPCKDQNFTRESNPREKRSHSRTLCQLEEKKEVSSFTQQLLPLPKIGTKKKSNFFLRQQVDSNTSSIIMSSWYRHFCRKVFILSWKQLKKKKNRSYLLVVKDEKNCTY